MQPGVEFRVVVGSRQARRAAMFIVPRSNALKLRRSAMLTEHFAPTGLGRCGLAMAINISLLTEFSCVCSTRKFPNSTAVHPGPLPLRGGEGESHDFHCVQSSIPTFLQDVVYADKAKRTCSNGAIGVSVNT